MSESEQLAKTLGEQTLETRTQGIVGLVLGIGAKYGLPSLACIYLFYVIQQKDDLLYSSLEKVTTALVESNNAGRDQAAAMNRLADAISKQSLR